VNPPQVGCSYILKPSINFISPRIGWITYLFKTDILILEEETSHNWHFHIDDFKRYYNHDDDHCNKDHHQTP